MYSVPGAVLTYYAYQLIEPSWAAYKPVSKNTSAHFMRLSGRLKYYFHFADVETEALRSQVS